MGALIIGSKTTPVEEAITHGKNGLLVDFFDDEALANTVVKALNHPEKYQHLRDAARKTAIERYDLKTVCLPQQIKMINDLGKDSNVFVISRRQPPIDFPRDAIGQPIGVPTEGKRALSFHRGKLPGAHALRGFAHRFRRTGDNPPHNAAATLGQTRACGIQQAVLARTRWSDEIDQPARHQNTLFACRQTCWTTGSPSRLFFACTRSARRPTAISPRSLRPAACAGARLIIFTARERSPPSC